MLDMFVISGAKECPCQACGKELIPLEYGDHLCKCGQPWRIRYSLGDPFALMTLHGTGKSVQSGSNPYYSSGYLVQALQGRLSRRKE